VTPPPICSLPHRNLSEAEAGRGRGPGEGGAWGGPACPGTEHLMPRPIRPQRCLTVSLQLPGGPSGLTFELPKLPDSEARPRLQALMLELAERVRGLERRLADVEAMAASPRKKSCLSGQKLFMPDSERRRGGSGPGTRKRMPGESLINPGFKSKKAPSGVDFDDS
uniref:PAXX non-homologous end joining factor n=1 Tax=Ornithorhynchus anatinus TaxID=9258 RepID=A0A6I8N3L4_ORNAN